MKSAARPVNSIRLEPWLYALALAGFCAPLLRCDSISVSGWQALLKGIAGTGLPPTVHADLLRHLLVWELIAISAALLALAFSVFGRSYHHYGFLLALAGLISLLMAQAGTGQANIDWLWGYWSLLAVFAAAASFNYMTRPRTIRPRPAPEIHINIITGKLPGDDRKNS